MTTTKVRNRKRDHGTFLPINSVFPSPETEQLYRPINPADAGIDPKCFGAAPGPLVRAGIIRADGCAATSRPVRHARPVTVWALADRDGALGWLRNNPDLPDPADDDQGDGSRGFLFPVHTTNEPGAAVPAAAPGMED
jgi:hypothetical protein